MTNAERKVRLGQDPRVIAVISDAEGHLVHLAPGWTFQAMPFIFHRKMRVIHGTLMRQTTPDPANPPDLKGWGCLATIPGHDRTFFDGTFVASHPGGTYWKVHFSHNHKPCWHSIKSGKLKNFSPP